MKYHRSQAPLKRQKRCGLLFFNVRQADFRRRFPVRRRGRSGGRGGIFEFGVERAFFLEERAVKIHGLVAVRVSVGGIAVDAMPENGHFDRAAGVFFEHRGELGQFAVRHLLLRPVGAFNGPEFIGVANVVAVGVEVDAHRGLFHLFGVFLYAVEDARVRADVGLHAAAGAERVRVAKGDVKAHGGTAAGAVDGAEIAVGERAVVLVEIWEEFLDYKAVEFSVARGGGVPHIDGDEILERVLLQFFVHRGEFFVGDHVFEVFFLQFAPDEIIHDARELAPHREVKRLGTRAAPGARCAAEHEDDAVSSACVGFVVGGKDDLERDGVFHEGRFDPFGIDAPVGFKFGLRLDLVPGFLVGERAVGGK